MAGGSGSGSSYKVEVKMLARATVMRFDWAGGSITKLVHTGPHDMTCLLAALHHMCLSKDCSLNDCWFLPEGTIQGREIETLAAMMTEVASHLFCFILFIRNGSLDSAYIAREAPSLKGRSSKAFVNTFLNHQKNA